MGNWGFPLPRKVIKKLVVDIVKSSNRAPRINLEKGPTDKWMRAFLKRHPDISLRKPHPLERERLSLSREQISHYFKLLSDTLDQLDIKDDPTRIFNLDETGFSGKEFGREKVLVAKGTKHPYQPNVSISGHVTLQVAISASGKIVSPLVIFSKNLPRREYASGIPDDWSFCTTESGYINSDIFTSWFRDCFIPNAGKSRPILVLMDNHSSHLNKEVIDVARASNVELLCLPSHSTHLLQPLDIGVYHLLKQNIATMSTRLGYTGMKTIPRQKFSKLLHLALNKIRGSDVSSSFSCAGICPYNPQKVEVDNLPCTAAQPVVVSDNPDEVKPKTCVTSWTCGKSTENELVTLGIISEDPQEILVPSQECVKSKGKRKRLDKAWVITALELNMDVPNECATAKKRQSAAIIEINEQPQSPLQALVDIDIGDGVLCEICMTDAEFTWIGCDVCEHWIHYECASHEIQTEFDLSLVTGSIWKCNTCRNEQ